MAAHTKTTSGLDARSSTAIATSSSVAMGARSQFTAAKPSCAPEPGRIFEMRPTRVSPLRPPWVVEWAFPAAVHLGRARGGQASDRLALLVHGLAMNEDYFGLLAPQLIAPGYDVWAIRLPGYAASGERPSLLTPLHHGLSIRFYGWVIASAFAHLRRTLRPRPSYTLAWGHSLGGAALTSALSAYGGADACGVDRLVLEAPAFQEALALSGAWITLFTLFPDALLNLLARLMFVDDIRSSAFAERQSTPFVPGRTSRTVLTLNAIALANPLNSTSRPPAHVLERAWFVVGEFDRLIDHDGLMGLLDRWHVAAARRLVLPRNHLLALTCSREMVEWVEGD